MSLRKSMAFFLATQFVVGDYALASLGNGAEEVVSINGLMSRSKQSKGLEKGSWYSLDKTVTVSVLEQVGVRDNVNVQGLDRLVLVAGTEVSILELSPDGRQAMIGVDENGFAENNPGVDPESPVIAWVPITELTRSHCSSLMLKASKFLDATKSLNPKAPKLWQLKSHVAEAARPVVVVVVEVVE